MDLLKLRKYARGLMSIGAAAIFIGAAIMVHGEMNFGDGVLVAGVISLIVGVALLARTPTGETDVLGEQGDDTTLSGDAK